MTRYINYALDGIAQLLTPAPFRRGEKYSTKDFRADLGAGVTVAVILVPQAMALALIAGLPAVYGLYAALPGFIASLWGSSRHLSTGPVAIVSFLTLSSLIPFAEPGTTDFILLASALALLVGLMQLATGVLRLGFIMQLIPHSAIAGFTSAAAAIIVLTQIPSLLGYTTEQHEFVFQNIFQIFTNIHFAGLFNTIVGVLALLLLILCRRLPKTFPGTLIVLSLAIIASYVFDLASLGVTLVSNIPSALPSFTVPTLAPATFFSLIPKAAIIAFVGFVEAHAIAKAVAAKTHQQLDTNQELVGQGLANIVGGFFKGYPVSGSFLRTAVNVDAGARTGYAAVVTAVVTVSVLLFFSPLLAFLPRSVLAAIVIVSAWSLIDLSKLKRIYGAFHTDGIVAYATFGIAFILKPDDAIFIGILLALIMFIRQTVWGAKVTEMGIDPKWYVLRDVTSTNGVERVPGSLIVRPGMSLYYANANHIVEGIQSLFHARARTEKPHSLILDFSGVNFVDVTGAEVLGEFLHNLKREGVHPYIIYLRNSVRDSLRTTHHFPDTMVLHNIAELKQYCGAESNTLTIASTKPDILHSEEHTPVIRA